MSFRAQTPQRKAEILVVTPGFASSDGGAGQVAGELITAMSRRTPFRFTWAAHAGAARGRAAYAEGATPEMPGPIPMLRNPTLQSLPPQTFLPMRGWNFVENTFGVRWPIWDRRSLQALRQAIASADCVWIHDTLYPGAQAAFRMARALNRPVLATQHDIPAFYTAHGNLLRRGWDQLADRLITSPLLRQARQVTFTSNALARFYQRRLSSRMPIRVIPNGVEDRIFRPPSADEYGNLRARFALRDDQPVLLFVGRFEKSGGLSVIRHMAQLLPKWRFWLAGQGHIKPEAWYLPNVQVFRDRTGERLAELYQVADLLIMPGYDPGSPHVFQQALACKLPVMCSPAIVSGQSGAACCLVVNTYPASSERTAKRWVQKLKAGKDVWPAPPEGKMPFDSSRDWLQVAAHYNEILQDLCRSQGSRR